MGIFILVVLVTTVHVHPIDTIEWCFFTEYPHYRTLGLLSPLNFFQGQVRYSCWHGFKVLKSLTDVVMDIFIIFISVAL